MVYTKSVSCSVWSGTVIIIWICMTRLETVQSYAFSYQDTLSKLPESADNNGQDNAIPLGLMNLFASSSKTSSNTNNWQVASPGKHRKKQLVGTDEFGRVQMGVEDAHCDDGKTNLTVDWDMSPSDYTCFHPESRYPSEINPQPLLQCEDLPDSYRPEHHCMNQEIVYEDDIPSYGPHRPLWPKFGEYLYVPRQRWLHNIEHGAVVFLYHPCAEPMEVKRLKQIVKRCFGKHVITPSPLLPHDRPLGLVAWGCKLLMSVVDDDAAMDFIRQKALHGPEGTYTKEGQFEEGLIDFSNKSGNAIYDRVTC